MPNVMWIVAAVAAAKSFKDNMKSNHRYYEIVRWIWLLSSFILLVFLIWNQLEMQNSIDHLEAICEKVVNNASMD